MNLLTNSLTLKSTYRAAAQKVPRTYGEEINEQASGQGMEGQGAGQLTLGQSVPLADITVPLLSPIPPSWHQI